MALENTNNITLTSAGGTFLVDLFQTSQNVIEVFSLGPVTLSANVVINRNIPPMGTLVNTHLKLRWNAVIVPNGYTVTIFGTTIDSEILGKNFIVDIYVSPYGNVLNILVDYRGLDSIFSNVDSAASTLNAAAVYTANMAGVQVLKTLNLPSGVFTTAGDRIQVRVTGAFASNAHNKTLYFGIYDGTNYSNNVITVDGDTHFTLDYEFVATHITNGEHRENYKLYYTDYSTTDYEVYTVNTANSNSPAYNYGSSTMQFILKGEENTPSGTEIGIHGIDITRVRTA